MQCWRVTVISAVRCATAHRFSFFTDGFPYVFTATPAGWRDRPDFNLPRRLITFTAKQGAPDGGLRNRLASTVQC